MNYQKHYDLLINRSKNRILKGYGEFHHIIPRCIGGDDSENNIVLLTGREHYIAHQLLIRIYPNEPKLIFAAKMMTVSNIKHKGNRSKNKLYSWLKEKFNENMKGQRNPMFGYNFSDKVKKFRRERLLGKSWEEIYGEEKAKKIRKNAKIVHSGDWNKKFGINETNIRKKKIGQKHKGKIPWNKNKNHTEEHKENSTKGMLKAMQIKKIQCIETGEIFNSAAQAARKINGWNTVILKCAYGSLKSAYGYTWRFINVNKKK